MTVVEEGSINKTFFSYAGLVLFACTNTSSEGAETDFNQADSMCESQITCKLLEYLGGFGSW